jgi:predicted DNA repair protein MutK
MDDVGSTWPSAPGARVAAFGRGLVKGMPKLLTGLTVVGTARCCGSAATSCGRHARPRLDCSTTRCTTLEEAATTPPALGGVAGWLVNTLAARARALVGALLCRAELTLHRKDRPAARALGARWAIRCLSAGDGSTGVGRVPCGRAR